MQQKFYLVILLLAIAQISFAGNPDRQGEAGATQLLLNPWARSAGLSAMTTANIAGVEALRLNVAGLVRAPGRTQIMGSHARYFEGTGVAMNALGLAQKVGSSGAFGVSIMTMDFGDIPVTTEDFPDGTGATFSPLFFNMAISYAHEFENKVSVGLAVRIVSEGLANVNANGIGIDAGVQYVTGDNDEFKFGISLRNVGTPMKYKGDGLTQSLQSPNPDVDGDLSFFTRSNQFDMPSLLNIGASYDFIINPKHRITLVGNFTSNTFYEDQIGGGVEYVFNDMFMLRGGYKYELDTDAEVQQSVYNGVSAGASVQVPFNKEKGSNFGIDYAYRHTNLWSGTHNISIRFDL